MLHSNYHRATARSARTATIPLKLCVNKTITMLVGICLVLAFLFLLFPAKALAYSPTQQRYVGSATTYAPFTIFDGSQAGFCGGLCSRRLHNPPQKDTGRRRRGGIRHLNSYDWFLICTVWRSWRRKAQSCVLHSLSRWIWRNLHMDHKIITTS